MYFLISIFMRLIFINIINDVAAMHYGTKVEEGNFKFVAYIIAVIGEEQQACGGVIIDEFHVITAAHCVVCSGLSQIYVFAGSASEAVSHMYRTATIHVYPNSTSTQGRSIIGSCLDYLTSCFWPKASEDLNIPANDIAVVKVERRITLGDDFIHLKLPDSKSLPHCQLLHFAGWYSPLSIWSASLQSTEIILVHDRDCNVQHSKEHFCANTIDLVGRIGPGDSGTPLVHQNTLYGILLGGADTPGVPFVFTKVSRHINFITEVLGKGKR